MKQYKATFYDPETEGDITLTMHAHRKTIVDVAAELQEILGINEEIKVEEV